MPKNGEKGAYIYYFQNLPKDYKVLRVNNSAFSYIDWKNRPTSICPLRGLAPTLEGKKVAIRDIATTQGQIQIKPDSDLLIY